MRLSFEEKLFIGHISVPLQQGGLSSLTVLAADAVKAAADEVMVTGCSVSFSGKFFTRSASPLYFYTRS